MKRKKNNAQNNIYNILDSNYFHICIDTTNNTWKVYYKNLPPRVYYSKINKPILTSENNTIDDIYKLKNKFEMEKTTELNRNVKEYINILKEVDYNMLNIKQIFSEMLTIILIFNLIASIINLIFINDRNVAMFQMILSIFTAIIGICKINQAQKENNKGRNRIEETFIKGKIRKQGLYFVQKLKGELKNDI